MQKYKTMNPNNILLHLWSPNDLEVEVGQNVVYSAAKIELMPDILGLEAPEHEIYS